MFIIQLDISGSGRLIRTILAQMAQLMAILVNSCLSCNHGGVKTVLPPRELE